MRVLLTAAMLLPLAFGSGCFVFEEIDSGMAIMEAHTPAANKKKQAEEQYESAKATAQADLDAARTGGAVTDPSVSDPAMTDPTIDTTGDSAGTTTPATEGTTGN